MTNNQLEAMTRLIKWCGEKGRQPSDTPHTPYTATAQYRQETGDDVLRDEVIQDVLVSNGLIYAYQLEDFD